MVNAISFNKLKGMQFMITLRPITKENLIPVTDLQMEDSQMG